MPGDPYADLTGGPQQPSPSAADPYADLTGGSSASADPYADLTEPGALTQAGSIIEHLVVPYQGESAFDVAKRDVSGVVHGLVDPFVTLGKRAAYAEAPLVEALGGHLPFEEPSLKETALAGLQAGATVVAGPAAKALGAGLGGSLAARLAAGSAVGAATGPLFSPDHKAAAALVGAFLGGVFHPGAERVAPVSVEDIAAKYGVDPDALKARLAYGKTSPDVLIEQMKTNQGFAVNPRTGEAVTEGFAVGGLAKRGEGTVLATAPEQLTPELVGQHLQSMNTLFHDNPNVTYGGWVNPETGQVEIEPGEVFPRLGSALVRGAEVGEQAVYDIRGQRTVEVPDLDAITEAAREWEVDKETAAEILSGNDATAPTDAPASALEPAPGPPVAGGGRAPGAGEAGDHAAEGVDAGGAGGVDQPVPGAAGGDGGRLVPRPPADGGGGGGRGAPPGGGPGGVGPSDFYGGDHDPVNLDDYLNRAKIVTSDPVAQAAIDVNLARAAEAHGPKVRISHAETLQAAKDILNDPDAARELSHGLGLLTREQAVAALLTIRRNALAMSGLARAFEDGTAVRGGDAEAAFQALSDAQERIMGRLIQTRSEFGRSLNALKIEASQTTDPTYWLLRARRAAGRQLTPEEAVDIQRRLDRVREAQAAYDEHPSTAHLLQRNQARGLLASGVEDLKDVSGFRKASTVYRAFLLSSAHTLLGAIAGHTSYGALQAVDETLVSAMDRAIGGMLTHLYATDMPLAQGLAARWRGVKMGAQQLASIVKTGVSGSEAAVDERMGEFRWEKAGDTGLTLAAKHIAGKPVRLVMRLFRAFPQVVRMQAYQYEFESQLRAAIRRASPDLTEGRLRSEVVRLKELGDQTPMTDVALTNAGMSKTTYLKERAMVAEAKQRASLKGDEASLMQRNLMTDLVQHAKREIEERAPAGRFLADVAVPFTTVPSNIAVEAARHTPLSAAFGLRNFVKLVDMAHDARVSDEVKLALQRKVAEQLVKAGTGSAAMALGYVLAERRLVSGPSADSKAARDTRMLAGEQPNSLLLDGSWFSDAKLAPVANMIELGGILHTALNDDRLRGSAAQVAYVAKKFGAEMADAPYFDGMQHAVRALEDPGSFASKYVEEVAKGVVPNILARVEYASDPYRREVGEDSFLQMIGQTIESRIPGLASRLPVERNQFGEPIVHPTGFLTYFNPFPSMADRTDDPAVRVLLESGTNVARLPREPGETEPEYEARQQRFGHYLHDYLTRLARSPGYRSLPSVAQRLMVREPHYFGDADEGRLTTALRYMVVSRLVQTIRDHAGRFVPATGRMPKALAREASVGAGVP